MLYKRIQSVLGELRALFTLLLFVLAACGDLPSNMSAGNTVDSATSGSGAGSDGDSADTSTVSAITFNNNAPTTLLQSRSFKVILAPDISFKGAALASQNWLLEMGNNNYDQLFDLPVQ